MAIDHLAIVYLSTPELILHWGVDDCECKLFVSHVESLCCIQKSSACSDIRCIDSLLLSRAIDHSKRFNLCFDFVYEFNVLIVFFCVSGFLFFWDLRLCSSGDFSLLCRILCRIRRNRFSFFFCIFVSFLVSRPSCFSPCVWYVKIFSKNEHCFDKLFAHRLFIRKLIIDSKIDNCFVESQTLSIVLYAVCDL